MVSIGETVLQLTGVSKRFGPVAAVSGVSLEIRRGELFTLLGPSGCGKTTVLRLVAGLERPDAGEITLRGRVVASAERRLFVGPHKRNLGMVFQSYAIWPHMTVFENVAYPLALRGARDAIVREKVTRVLDLVGLNGLETRSATRLSGGQMQRLALCRSLVYEPDLLLLDEPFSRPTRRQHGPGHHRGRPVRGRSPRGARGAGWRTAHPTAPAPHPRMARRPGAAARFPAPDRERVASVTSRRC